MIEKSPSNSLSFLVWWGNHLRPPAETIHIAILSKRAHSLYNSILPCYLIVSLLLEKHYSHRSFWLHKWDQNLHNQFVIYRMQAHLDKKISISISLPARCYFNYICLQSTGELEYQLKWWSGYGNIWENLAVLLLQQVLRSFLANKNPFSFKVAITFDWWELASWKGWRVNQILLFSCAICEGAVLRFKKGMECILKIR